MGLMFDSENTSGDSSCKVESESDSSLSLSLSSSDDPNNNSMTSSPKSYRDEKCWIPLKRKINESDINAKVVKYDSNLRNDDSCLFGYNEEELQEDLNLSPKRNLSSILKHDMHLVPLVKVMKNDQYSFKNELKSHVKKDNGSSQVSPIKTDAKGNNLNPESIYEVEGILDFTNDDGTDFYLVKWKGWSDEENTWEPSSNLDGCQTLIKKFHRLYPYLKGSRKKIEFRDCFGITEIDMRSTKEKRMDTFLWKNSRVICALIKLIAEDQQILSSSKRSKTSRLISKYLNSLADHTEEIKYTVKMPEGTKRIKMTGEKFKRFMKLKKRSAQKLKDWQDEINKVSTDPASIVVINDIDLEYAPESFTYINDYEAGEGIVIPDDPLVGCECHSCYSNQASCCGHQSGSTFAYTKNKRLKVGPGNPIYECNKRCSCGPDCVNRVVQFGRKVKLAIFRTANSCGWGVKTLEPIPKGSFVMEYVGEVITEQEAERRGHKYDAEGRTYLFDLDYDDGDNPFTVDAAYLGNISHFMNHSCEPNLAVYGVWINSLDPRLPRLAFFSKRDIKRGEELSFDYMMSANTSEANISLTKSPQSALPKLSTTGESQKRILCKCGSVNCRKYLF